MGLVSVGVREMWGIVARRALGNYYCRGEH